MSAPLITDKFRVFNAKQFLESFDETTSTNHYFFVGRSAEWDTVLEYYGADGVPQVNDTVTLTSTRTGTVTAVTDNGDGSGSLLVSGLDPATAGKEDVGNTITVGAVNVSFLRLRVANEDAPLFPADNYEEKYSTYREIVAAKRIYDNTDGQNTGSSPDGSYVRSVVQRLDYGLTEIGAGRTAPYDMWRHDYQDTANFRKAAATGNVAYADLEMVVRNSDYEVWMCIDNNNGATPDAVAAGPRTSGGDVGDPDAVGYTAATQTFLTTAGYRWKYLYTMSTNDVIRFQSQKFIPLPPSNYSYTNGLGVAKATNTVGPEVVVVTSGGSNYPNGTLYAPINGDGQVDGSNYKVAQLTVAGGVITGARVLAAGEAGYANDPAYTYASINTDPGDPTRPLAFRSGIFTDAGLTTAAGTGSGAALEVIIPPPGGYGTSNAGGLDPLQQQLNAKRVMANIRLTFGEGTGDFPVTNDFRRIGLLKDPYAYAGDGVGTEITNANSDSYQTVRNTYAVKFNADPGLTVNFLPDEEISQELTINGTNVFAKGKVVEWLPTTDGDPTAGGTLRFYQDPVLHAADNGTVYQFHSAAVGDVTAVAAVVGSESGATSTPNAATANVTFATDPELYPELEPNTGEIIYVENRRLITRAADQIEDIKLVIEF